MRVAVAAVLFLVACGAQRAPGPDVSRVETAPGVSLYVERYGEGPNVIMAPGRLFLASEFQALAARDRTLILYDMRNRGASSYVADGAQLTIMEDVRDIEALRAHFGAERISLIGYSYLGLMTALYAAEHPDRVERLVQIGPVPRRWDTPYPPELTAGEDSLSAEGRAARLASEQARESLGADQAELCAIELRATAYWVVGDPANAARFPNTCEYENEWPANFERHINLHFGDLRARDFPAEMFAALTLPVLTIHGTLDRNAPYGAGREWARTFRDGRLVTVRGGAHNVWLDDPDVIPEIDRFLRGEWPARAEIIR